MHRNSYVGTVCFRRAQILPTPLMRFKLRGSLPFADGLLEVHCTIETEDEIQPSWNGMLVKAHACGMACPSVGAGRLLFVTASNQPRLTVSHLNLSALISRHYSSVGRCFHSATKAFTVSASLWPQLQVQVHSAWHPTPWDPYLLPHNFMLPAALWLASCVRCSNPNLRTLCRQ